MKNEEQSIPILLVPSELCHFARHGNDKLSVSRLVTTPLSASTCWPSQDSWRGGGSVRKFPVISAYMYIYIPSSHRQGTWTISEHSIDLGFSINHLHIHWNNQATKMEGEIRHEQILDRSEPTKIVSSNESRYGFRSVIALIMWLGTIHLDAILVLLSLIFLPSTWAFLYAFSISFQSKLHMYMKFCPLS